MHQRLAVQALGTAAAMLPGPAELPPPWLLYRKAALCKKVAEMPCHRGAWCCEGWPAEATGMSGCLPACLQLIAGHRQQALASILHHSLVLFCIEQTASPSYGHRQQALASMLHHSLMVFCVEQTASLIYALLRSENTRCKRRARLLCQLLLAAIICLRGQAATYPCHDHHRISPA